MNRDIPTIIRDLNRTQDSIEQVKIDLPNTYAGSAQWERLHCMRLEAMKELNCVLSPVEKPDLEALQIVERADMESGGIKLLQIKPGLQPACSCGNPKLSKTTLHRDNEEDEWEDWGIVWGGNYNGWPVDFLVKGHVVRGARCDVCKAVYLVE